MYMMDIHGRFYATFTIPNHFSSSQFRFKKKQLFNHYTPAPQRSGNTNFAIITIDASLLCLTMERMLRARGFLFICTRSENKQMSIQNKINFSL